MGNKSHFSIPQGHSWPRIIRKVSREMGKEEIMSENDDRFLSLSGIPLRPTYEPESLDELGFDFGRHVG